MGALGVLATYPVLPEARDWLRDHGPDLEGLLTDFLYARARDRARRRVWEALEEPKKKEAAPDTDSVAGRDAASGIDTLSDPFLRPPGIDDPVGMAAASAAYGDDDGPLMLSEVDEEMELVAHPLTRMLVAAVGQDYLARRFAVQESKRLSKALDRDPAETTAAVARAFDMPFLRRDDDEGRTFGLYFSDYLATAPNEKKWKLPWRDLEEGHVWLDKEDFARLVEEVYKRRLERELKDKQGAVPGQVLEVFKSDLQRLKTETERRVAKYREEQSLEMDEALFPPCMHRIVQDMANHVNIPHMGRFAIVAFLHNLGNDVDDILRFFSRLPDFNADKSRYQIEHITGKGGPTEYTPPGCATMQTHGVCPLEERDDTCAKIKHPMQYYRRRIWWKNKQKQRYGGAKGGDAKGVNGKGAANTANGEGPGAARGSTPSRTTASSARQGGT